jgi:putative membrane protein
MAAVTVLAQIAYPLTHGDALRRLTIVTVVLFAATVVAHAWLTRGAAWALALAVVAAGAGLLVEGVGLRTGRPFGHYAYSDSLGAQVWSVPVVVPLAWLMMSYPCLLLGRTLASRLAVGARRRGRRRAQVRLVPVALLGGAALAAWDLFIDPQMVAAGHWRWTHPQPGLPGTTGVPLTNALGWLAAGVLLIALLHVVLPGERRHRDWRRDRSIGLTDAVPAALLGWTWFGSTLGNAVFFNRPWVAVWGGVALGLLVLPYLLVVWGRRP